jgi:fructose-1,6-bisphosphatase II / sedoheptulose-1,7-bisphosphatase
MPQDVFDRDLTLPAVRVCELAAIAAAKLVGRGDEKQADQAAVDAMRTALNDLDIDGTIVIGEGERDEAPMLFIGEKVGRGGPRVDIALDPLEGTTLTAKAMSNALAVMAWSPDGGMLHAPDTYMDKIAIGPRLSPRAWWTSTPAPRTTFGPWPRPRASRWARSASACSTAPVTPSCWPACAASAPRCT